MNLILPRILFVLIFNCDFLSLIYFRIIATMSKKHDSKDVNLVNHDRTAWLVKVSVSSGYQLPLVFMRYDVRENLEILMKLRLYSGSIYPSVLF